MTYWVDEPRGVVFCLIEAPDKATVHVMHEKAHGLIPNKILEVSQDVVESFLGRIHDPAGAVITDKGLKVFSDPAYRVLLVTHPIDHILLRHRYGEAGVNALLNRQHDAVRQGVTKHGGRMVEQDGGCAVSFTTAADAVACALDIEWELKGTESHRDRLPLAITAGDPVSASHRLFGDALQLARRLCGVKTAGKIAVSASVKELLGPEFYSLGRSRLWALSPREEQAMNTLFDTLEAHWQDAEFDVERFCRMTAMSRSQLYRKTVELWEMSPNVLLREFRLNKACDLLKKQLSSVANVTFDSGFTSPSYFSKCFKETFGVLPAAYMNMV